MVIPLRENPDWFLCRKSWRHARSSGTRIALRLVNLNRLEGKSRALSTHSSGGGLRSIAAYIIRICRTRQRCRQRMAAIIRNAGLQLDPDRRGLSCRRRCLYRVTRRSRFHRLDLGYDTKRLATCSFRFTTRPSPAGSAPTPKPGARGRQRSSPIFMLPIRPTATTTSSAGPPPQRMVPDPTLRT